MRRVLVTGGGRGIGRAIGAQLVEDGFDVVLLARTRREVEAAADDIGAAAAVADVALPEQVQAAVGAFGPFDALVNNAGVLGPTGPLLGLDPESLRATLDVNFLGVVHCIQAAAPAMIRRGAGSIVNLSGGGATVPRPGFAAYACSKTALVRLTETLAAELRETGVRVNAVAPGAVETDMLAAARAAGEAQSGGDAQPVARLVSWLCGELSSGLTGKLVSALHDDWFEWADRLEELSNSPLYTLRRVDPYTLERLR